MLLVKRKIIKNLAVKCTLTALMAFPLGGCAADEDLNNQAPATISAEAPATTEGGQVATAETTAVEVPVQDPVLVARTRDALIAALPAGVTLKFMPELSSVYTTVEMKPLWEDEKVQKQFEQQLAEMALAGINSQFGQWAKLLTQPEITGMARDAVLSDALLGYMHFVEGAKANGNRWLYNNGSYKIAAPSVEMTAQWQQAVKDGNSAKFIQSLAPQNAFYSKMHESLKSLVEDVQPWPQMELAKQSLRPGNSNKDVPVLRDILARSGLIKSESEASAPKKKVSLVYSGELVDGVKRFQQMYGMETDGVIGNTTREALNMAPQTRAAILALNIQRLRLLPNSMDHGIFVNIPDYSLAYYVNSELVLKSRVIVGSVKRKTPLMSSALNNVVVNPPWNVPVKLIREDLAPKAKRDAEYLKRGGYTVYSGWGKGATVVDPSSIDWSAGGNYRLQQAPGSSNALGRFKFNMPNDDAIYLHDTPNHRLFDKNMRALSSGCIRVNKASELANILLNEVGWDDNRIQNTLKRGNTAYANIREEIPVQLYYMTSWVSNSGTPEFRTDIYGYDSAVQEGIKELPQVEKLLR
ncbi:L,D-transpeptidase [Jinshanibacter sp. LJY008]|uniref:L,D-transpeptidase n=1 Tax=Limnobaculum eriocheiris TaxID=2897391 RepID=A0A9X1MXH1_9GAMM|nr:L,D-transpeptidase [Limnobaculum eriocheiris]MCD1126779.1 L,D-transpeptidase [Limnobaculum eriocheiris]